MMETHRDRWNKTRMVFSIWFCGDWCECSQPRIEILTPDHAAGYPITRTDKVWRGDLICGATPQEIEKQRDDLRNAALKYNAILDEDFQDYKEIELPS